MPTLAGDPQFDKDLIYTITLFRLAREEKIEKYGEFKEKVISLIKKRQEGPNPMRSTDAAIMSYLRAMKAAGHFPDDSELSTIEDALWEIFSGRRPVVAVN